MVGSRGAQFTLATQVTELGGAMPPAIVYNVAVVNFVVQSCRDPAGSKLLSALCNWAPPLV